MDGGDLAVVVPQRCGVKGLWSGCPCGRIGGVGENKVVDGEAVHEGRGGGK